MNYEFDVNAVHYAISTQWLKWAETHNKSNKWIVGISGGIDSTTTAALACKIFGVENVYGISMPCDGQKDAADVDAVFAYLGIKRLDFDIGNTCANIRNGIESNAIEVTQLTRTNLPARIRMATVYAFAQSLDAIVLNTCNLSESLMGYDTLWGDDCGSYAPIQKLTKTEVRKIATYIGVPEKLVNKTPIDGLQGNTDEENFGFTYETLDKYIRTGVCDVSTIAKIINRYERGGKWKMKMVTIEGPEFDFPNYVTRS